MLQNEFVTADQHFGHTRMLEHRPFDTVEEMDEALIAAWNNKVPKGGIVYHLGDLSFYRKPKTIEILNRLNGRIRLIRGNHDRMATGGDALQHFEWVKDYYQMRDAGGQKLVVMCHYPMLTWNQCHYGSLMLHGHSHGKLKTHDIHRIDVGVDTNDKYAPYSFFDIHSIVEARTRGR